MTLNSSGGEGKRGKTSLASSTNMNNPGGFEPPVRSK